MLVKSSADWAAAAPVGGVSARLAAGFDLGLGARRICPSSAALLGQILRAPQPKSKPAAKRADTPPTGAAAAQSADDFTNIKGGIEELKEQGAIRDEVEPESQDGSQKALFRNLARSPA